MIYQCPKCASQFQSEHRGVVRCPSCQAEVRIEGPKTEVEWDAAKGDKLAEAFFQTVKGSIADPIGFFSSVGRGSGWFRPWSFAAIMSVAMCIIAAVYQVGFQTLAAGTGLGNAFFGTFNPFAALSVPFALIAVIMFAVVGMPIIMTAMILLQSGIFHLCLMILGAARRDFQSTFRVVCYSMGPQVFQVFPLIGGTIAGIWQVVLYVIGFKVVHDTSYGRSAVAVFLPMLVCCGIAILIASVVAGWGFAALLSMKH